jgi:MoaA/NifB/PqqE/SkfB family radical SAM enzyme
MDFKNKIKVFPNVYLPKYKFSVAPTMEITTCVPKQGCIVDCVFCPQKTLQKVYQGERYLSLDNFKILLDKIPKEIRITFAGFTEPWLNKHCSDMLLYAHEKGHPISAFTTGIGMNTEDVEKIKNIPYAGNPNGGFVLHLPDDEYLAKHPISKKYLEVLEYFKSVMHEIQFFSTMSMGPNVNNQIKHIFETSDHNAAEYMWSRAGNLLGEAILKPELINLKNKFKSIYHGEKSMTCNCEERLYHNVLLPNGDVSLCCMDYGLKHILGNLFTQEYEELIPKPLSCFDLCKFCENAIDVNDPKLEKEKSNMRTEDE